ncbi:MAG: alpha-amylase family glycosyl hydrolase [Candidatus Theseobacter exili]|nr:alpha-amylase family glycosyl hydrolase [Candidatus Theseobacter exili]
MKDPRVKYQEEYFPLEIQISKDAWERFFLTEGISSCFKEGAGDYPSPYVFRVIAEQMNKKMMSSTYLKNPVRAGQLNAAGLINEIFRYISTGYRIEKNPSIFADSISCINSKHGPNAVSKTVKAFSDLFPPYTVLKGKISSEDFIKGSSVKSTNFNTTAKEMFLLALALENPAIAPYRELFDDEQLKRRTPYKHLMGSLEEFFEKQPGYGPKKQSLYDLLKSPVINSPKSLTGQLEYIRDNWREILSNELMGRLMLAMDVIKEENKLGFLGPGEPRVLRFGKDGIGELGYEEYERFSSDADWMSKVVLIAKMVYVWLDQLSKKYKRSITRLDQIPDEELDILAGWGFSAIWLIGVWQRSSASQKIKQYCGNPEAAASAYSLYEYEVSADIGGEEALQNFRERAWKRGIRLASDMVPNHMGIFSRWVIDHPDWFIQLQYPPYPGYSFTGGNLSDDENIGLYIEDGYWDRRDAAVVFKRVDHNTGEERYIYHGNDGTSMPWNDTAQLNFLIPDVREAVIQTILHVARKFSIIRFDAAMTLAKIHYRRLWFPQYGEGGGIPSRSEQGMSKEHFDEVFPKEFWREVVDRVAVEAPDTLLLAEAFWLLEGYFVRTLGMHRVYNSAFMNMLKMEDNEKYRETVKNVIEFNPEILKRFVNFMNNPDEATAVAQFGKDDKYIGVAVLMVTMPGLPMFGHGQIEGYTEKYGMEYRKAYWDEEVDMDLVKRHEKEIFPLMRQRHLFSGVDNFVFYDFTVQGSVDDNVFAYSNRCGNERVLIIYNNSYNSVCGWIKTSVAFSLQSNSTDERHLVQKSVAEALNISVDNKTLYAFRDFKTGLEFIRKSTDISEKGLFFDLSGYQYFALLNFRKIEDFDGSWNRLEKALGGQGVNDIHTSYKELIYKPVLEPFRAIISKITISETVSLINTCYSKKKLFKEKDLDFLKLLIEKFYSAIKNIASCNENIEALIEQAILETESLAQLNSPLIQAKYSKYIFYKFTTAARKKSITWLIPLSWIALHQIGKLNSNASYETQSCEWFNDWILGKALYEAAIAHNVDTETAKQIAHMVVLLIKHQNLITAMDVEKLDHEKLSDFFKEPSVQEFLDFNLYKNVLWFNKEKTDLLLYWLFFVSVLSVLSSSSNDKKQKEIDLNNIFLVLKKINEMIEKSAYSADALFELIL